MDPELLESLNNTLVQAGYSGVSFCEDCEEKGCSCTERAGSWCSILKVVLRVARDTDSVEGLCKGMTEGEKFDIVGVGQLINCECNDGIFFQQRHSTFLDKLERQFRSFPPRIR